MRHKSTEPTLKMLRMRQLRMKGYTLEEIGKKFDPPITKQGVRAMIILSDRFYDLKLGKYSSFRKFKRRMKLTNVGKKSVHTPQEASP